MQPKNSANHTHLLIKLSRQLSKYVEFLAFCTDETLTFFGEFRRSAYRASAFLTMIGEGKGEGREAPPSGVPSSLSAWMVKNVSGE